jgi:hypothetical protein
VLLWLGIAPALPLLYISLYACYNLFHPIRLATISDLAGKVRAAPQDFSISGGGGNAGLCSQPHPLLLLVFLLLLLLLLLLPLLLVVGAWR